MRVFLLTSLVCCFLSTSLCAYDGSKRKWFFLHGGLDLATAVIGATASNSFGYSLGYGIGLSKDFLISLDIGGGFNLKGEGTVQGVGNIMYYLDNFSYASIGSGTCAVLLREVIEEDLCIFFGYGKHLSLGSSIELRVGVMENTLEEYGQAYISTVRYRGFWF